MSILDEAGLPLAAIVAVVTFVAVIRESFALALGVLLAAASISGITATVGSTGIRIEQPAIVVLAVWLAIRRPSAWIALFRRAHWPILFGVIFLGANVASAILFAPDRLQSLKICLWLAISMAGAMVAAILVTVDRASEVDRQVVRWVVGAAALHAVVAAFQVGAELLVNSDWGVLRSDTPLGKTFGLAWEPNLLAIQLAAASMFVLGPIGRAVLPPRARGAALVVIPVGIALALSRGGIVAGIAGIAILVAAVASRRPHWSRTARLVLRDGALVGVVAIVGYVGLSWLAAQGVGLRPGEIAAAPEAPQGTLVPISAQGSPGPGTSVAGAGRSVGPGASGSLTDTATPTPGPDARYLGAGDTIELRVRNFRIAVSDGLTSPLLGFGPDTFGQRYIEPTCSCPAHVPNQLSATFYESGAIGLFGLVALLSWIIVSGLRRRLDVYIASLATLLIGFQFTDALRFGATWLLIGTIIGLTIRVDAAPATADPAPPDRP